MTSSYASLITAVIAFHAHREVAINDKNSQKKYENGAAEVNAMRIPVTTLFDLTGVR